MAAAGTNAPNHVTNETIYDYVPTASYFPVNRGE